MAFNDILVALTCYPEAKPVSVAENTAAPGVHLAARAGVLKTFAVFHLVARTHHFVFGDRTLVRMLPRQGDIRPQGFK